MRAFYVTILWVACWCPAQATVYTLSNMPSSAGQFNTFNAAHTAAANGDTIYVHGSSISYGNVSISKRLVIIGTGHHPDKQNPLVSSFGQVIIFANGVQLIGLVMSYIGGATNVNDAVVRKCRIYQTSFSEALSMFSCFNWLIEGNIFVSNGSGIISFATASDGTIIRNNVFIVFNSAIVGIHNLSNQRTTILNNVFLGTGFSSYSALFDLQYCTIDNNIFYAVPPEGSSTALANCLMNHNMSFGSTDDTFYQPGANNLAATDPLFTTYSGSPSNYDYTWDLRLQPTSFGHNSGTDGTDRGVFGGTGEIFTVTGEPAIAEITAFTITSPTTIAPGGTLTISVTSKRVH